MNNPLILTLDFGTQSVRASLTNKKGEIEAIEKKIYEPSYFSIKKGYAEQHADFYWECAVEVLKRLTSNNKEILDRIIACSLTTFRDTSVQLDKDLKPIRPCILWLDQRMAEAKEKVPLLYRFLFFIIGMKETIVLNRKRTIAHWLKENEEDNWKKTYKYVNISTYLTYKLTNKLVDSSSSMTGHYPINYKNGKWHGEKSLMGSVFGIPDRMLCELKQPGELLGVLTDEVSDLVGLPRGIKLIATGSDKACETIGVGALSRDIAAVSYGTACSIEVSNKKYHEPEPFLPAYNAATPGWYNMDVQIYRGYWMLKWFSKEFAGELLDEAKIQKMAVEELLNKGLELIPPGSDGLVLQPYWGPGLSRPLAKGSIIGFSDNITRNHFYKAIIEGIAYGLKEGLNSIEKSQKHKVKEIRVSGGGSNSAAICQITADIFNLPVRKIQTGESSTLGCAISTFVALKEFENVEQAISNMVHVEKTYIPNKKNAAIYDDLFRDVYLKIYPNLKEIYKTIKKHNEKVY